MPVAAAELVRFLSEAGVYCPAAILVQQTASNGTRLVYDAVPSSISACGDEELLTVARDIDTAVLALLRRAADRD